MSGGTSPATRSITKKGAPSTAASVSHHSTRGIGSAPSSTSACITRNWRGMSQVGNTGNTAGPCATRPTNDALRRAPPSRQLASNSSVSLDMPFVAGPASGETSASPKRLRSQPSRRSRSRARSRVEVRGRAAGSVIGLLPAERGWSRSGRWSKLRRSEATMAQRFEVQTESDVAIAMPDGVELFADVHHPRGAGDCPTILTRCPYGRAMFTVAARAYAAHGYHVVLQDCRGTAPSKGAPALFSEGADGRATGDWIARQPWFDGRLGAEGGSYLGFTALAFAATRPPHLKALSLQVVGAERHAAWFPGGSFALDLALSWSQIRVATRDGGLDMSDLPKLAASMKEMGERLERAFLHVPLGEADRVATGETLPWFQDWLAHADVHDPFWKPLDYREILVALRLPTLLVDGWYDYQVPNMVEDYRRLRAAGIPTRLVVGPWAHPTLDPAVIQGEVLAWFDAHLRGEPATAREGPVRVFVMPDAGWRELPAWPPQREARRFWLQPGGALASE